MKLVVSGAVVLSMLVPALFVDADATFHERSAAVPGWLLDVREGRGEIIVTLGERLEIRARRAYTQASAQPA